MASWSCTSAAYRATAAVSTASSVSVSIRFLGGGGGVRLGHQLDNCDSWAATSQWSEDALAALVRGSYLAERASPNLDLMLLVGLTGNIGSGKSTVAQLLSERGATI